VIDGVDFAVRRSLKRRLQRPPLADMLGAVTRCGSPSHPRPWTPISASHPQTPVPPVE
jgi:hypothetical protein